MRKALSTFLFILLVAFPVYAISTGDSFNTSGQLSGKYSYYAWYQTTAAGEGVWFDCSAVRSASIHVTALATGDTFVVQVSNAASVPANTTDGVTDQTITGDGTEKFVTLSKLPARFCKVDKTGSTATATALFHGLSR